MIRDDADRPGGLLPPPLRGRVAEGGRAKRGPFPHERVPTLRRLNAKRMRHEPTAGEKRLWRILRAHRLDELGFRRHAPMGPYIADFVCQAAKWSR